MGADLLDIRSGKAGQIRELHVPAGELRQRRSGLQDRGKRIDRRRCQLAGPVLIPQVPVLGDGLPNDLPVTAARRRSCILIGGQFRKVARYAAKRIV